MTKLKSSAHYPGATDKMKYLVLEILETKKKMKKGFNREKEVGKDKRKRNTSGMLLMDAIGTRKSPS